MIIKKLVLGKRRINGRNVSGIITVNHRGAGHKRRFRIIDFLMSLKNVPGQLKSIEYDPNRSSFISLVYFLNGIACYRLTPEKAVLGDLILNSTDKIDKNNFFNGNNYFIRNFSLGVNLYCLSRKNGSKAVFSRAAGAQALLMRKSLFFSVVKLRSGNEYKLNNLSIACFGVVSNSSHCFKKLRKAGQSRWCGVRPTVRGEAKNPVDHPHGGRTRGGRPDVTPWGIITKGKKTRKKNKSYFI